MENLGFNPIFTYTYCVSGRFCRSSFIKVILTESAESSGQLDLHVEWLEFALTLLGKSDKTKKKRVREKLEEAKQNHDFQVLEHGPVDFSLSRKSNYKRTRATLFDKSLEDTQAYQTRLAEYR